MDEGPGNGEGPEEEDEMETGVDAVEEDPVDMLLAIKDKSNGVVEN